MPTQRRPVVVSLCATFLRKEALHIYRQVVGLRRYEQWVLTRKRRNADLFPFERVDLLRRDPVGIYRLLRQRYYGCRGVPCPWSLYEVAQARRVARTRDPAVVHVYFATDAVKALPYLRREARPKVVSLHGVDLSEALQPADLARLIECVDLFMVRTRAFEMALVERGCPPARVRANPTGVPLPQRPIPREAPIVGPERPLRVLQSCRFVEKKGLDVSVTAVRRLLDMDCAVTLDLAGEGPEEGRLRSLVSELGLGDRVRFLGFVENHTLLESLAGYDVFVHPSRETSTGDREGIPNSLLEAMAWGLVPIATRHSGIPDAVHDGENGLLVPVADPALLADALAMLCQEPRLYQRLSAAARETIGQRYSTEHSVTKLEAIYDEAVELGRRRSHQAAAPDRLPRAGCR